MSAEHRTDLCKAFMMLLPMLASDDVGRSTCLHLHYRQNHIELRPVVKSTGLTQGDMPRACT